MSPTPVLEHGPLRPSLSCNSCANRKVKCDRQKPSCNSCAKRGIDCVYQPEVAPRKRVRRRVKDLTDRIKHYEELLRQQHANGMGRFTSGALQQPVEIMSRSAPASEISSSEATESARVDSQPMTRVQSVQHLPTPPEQNMNPVTSAVHTPGVRSAAQPKSVVTSHKPAASVESDMPPLDEAGLIRRLGTSQVVVSSADRSKMVDNELWSRVVEEYDSAEDALDESSTDDELDVADHSDAFILLSGTKSGHPPQHPSMDHMNQLFEIYATNVDPLTKLVHIPTLRPAFGKASQDVHHTPRGFVALMFAIYSAAIWSLKEKECRERFGESKSTLHRRYTTSTKTALMRANFMGTISLVVLQALCVHIIAIRDLEESRRTWSLTGIAMRIAQSMGLDRDPDELHLPIFEGEIRRRIWWLLSSHDRRCAELCGLSKFRNLDHPNDAPRWPISINDDRLHPGMTTLEAQGQGITDMSFLCLRGELIKFATERIGVLKSQGKGPSLFNVAGLLNNQKDSLEACERLEAVFETKYIRYCDPSQPLHFMVMILARYAINVTRFLTSHPRRWERLDMIPPSERKYVWDISLRLLELHAMVLSNPQLQIFAWHAPYFMQWHGFIHTLDALRADPSIDGAEKAWQLVGRIYDNSTNMIEDMRKPIHVAVGNLCLKAHGVWETWRASCGRTCPTPDFILRLRQSLPRMRAKAMARREKHGQAKSGAAVSRQNILLSQDVLAWGQNTNQPLQGDTNGPYQIDGNMFWLDDSLDDHTPGLDFPDLMDIETEFTFDTDGHAVPESAAVQIDWARWDAWLANSNIMGSYLTPETIQSRQ